MFSIGEFSKITGLSIKTIRFYHEKELLIPARVEGGTGYRYFDQNNVESARVIVALRGFGFSLEEISSVLKEFDDEADILDYLEKRKQALREQIQKDRDIVSSIDKIIQSESEARRIMTESTFEVVEKNVDPLLVAGLRMKGRYEDVGNGFSQLGKKVGRYISGPALSLLYDGEYMEENADLEPCVPLRKQVDVEGISVRELSGGPCVTLLHKGPYTEIGRSYEQIMKYLNEKGYQALLPSREVYLKGPGMIFKGNPKKYLTEIQFFIEG